MLWWAKQQVVRASHRKAARVSQSFERQSCRRINSSPVSVGTTEATERPMEASLSPLSGRTSSPPDSSSASGSFRALALSCHHPFLTFRVHLKADCRRDRFCILTTWKHCSKEPTNTFSESKNTDGMRKETEAVCVCATRSAHPSLEQPISP